MYVHVFNKFTTQQTTTERMRFIAHRGNMKGPDPNTENRPETIDHAIQSGFDVEIDVRRVEDVLYLGHDTNHQYIIDLEFLLQHAKHLWIHCKNYDALAYLLPYKELNVFFHNTDAYTLTSHNHIWTYPYPEMQSNKNTVVVMPEWNRYVIDPRSLGVCSDYVLHMRECWDETAGDWCNDVIE